MSIGWPDLGGALLWVLGGLLVLGGIIGLLVWSARRRRSASTILDVTGAVARMWVALTGLGIVVTAWRWLSGGDTWLTDVPITLPWPESLPCEQFAPAEQTTTTLVCAHVATADLTIAALDLGTRLLLATSEILALAVVAAPGVVVAVACAQALRGTPFARVVSRTLLVVALVVLVAGMGAELAGSLGRALAATAVLAPSGSDAPVTTTGIYRLSIPLWPIGAALALGALGAVFRHGAQLQHDTERLV